MFPTQLRSSAAIAGLILALGILFLSVHGLVLYGGIYDIDLTSPANALDWTLEYILLCAWNTSVLAAYRLVVAKHQVDISPARLCLAVFLGFGGLLGIMGTMAGGWALGLNNFAFGGLTSALLGALIWWGTDAIVWAGTRLDKLWSSTRRER